MIMSSSHKNIQNSLEDVSKDGNHENDAASSIISSTPIPTTTGTRTMQKCSCYNSSPLLSSSSSVCPIHFHLEVKCLDEIHHNQLLCQQQNPQHQQQSQFSCTTPPSNYDSGNFTCNSNTSDSSLQPLTEDDEDSDDQLIQNFDKSRRKKSKTSLNLSISSYSNEIHKLRNELNRIQKSEQWYKNELKIQKRMRLELLERLYLNEHKFIKENQMLKIECDRWQKVYKELEQKYNDEVGRECFMRKLQNNFEQLNSPLVASINNNSHLHSKSSSIESLVFELQKQRNLCKEFEIINNLLRKHKSTLLNDLQTLMKERDSKIALYESKMVTLETENSQITKKCVNLVKENKNLHDRIKKAEELLKKAKNDLQKNEIKMNKLKFDYDSMCGLNNKNDEKLQEQENSTLIHGNSTQGLITPSTNINNTLQLNAQNIIKSNSQDNQVQNMNNDNFLEILDLKEKITKLEKLHEEELQNLCTNQSKLEIKIEEIQTLQTVLRRQSEYIKKLQEEIFEYKKLKENLDKYVNLLEANENELDIKQNEIEELKDILKQNQLQIETYYNENYQLRENVKELSEIQERNSFEIREKSEEINSLKKLSNNLKEEMSGVLLDRENLQKVRLELNSLLENEKRLRVSEVKELNKIIEEKSEEIMKQKLELEKYQKRCEELWNQIQFERSEFVSQQNSIIENGKCEMEDKTSSEISNFEQSTVESEKTSSQRNRKSHRVTVNLQLVGSENIIPDHNNQEFNKHIHNIEMLKTLLAQKSEKMTILSEEQEKWEKLLEELDGAQKSKDDTLKQLKEDEQEEIETLKSQLLEFSNLLKNKQDEIENLKQSLTEKCSNLEKLQNKFEKFHEAHYKQLKEIQDNYEQSKKLLKDELNAKLIEFEIFKPLLTAQEEKLKMSEKNNFALQQQIELMKQTIDDLQENIKALKDEKLEEVSKNVLETNNIECQTQLEIGNNGDDDEECKNYKIMKKVIESEHRKNIARYELHIRTLLTKIKSYKKTIRTFENRYQKLNEKYKELEALNEERTSRENTLLIPKDREDDHEDSGDINTKDGSQQDNHKEFKIEDIQVFERKQQEEEIVSEHENDNIEKFEAFKIQEIQEQKQKSFDEDGNSKAKGISEAEKSENLEIVHKQEIDQEIENKLQQEDKCRVKVEIESLQNECFNESERIKESEFVVTKVLGNEIQNKLQEEEREIEEEVEISQQKRKLEDTGNLSCEVSLDLESTMNCTKCVEFELKFQENIQHLLELEKKFQENEKVVKTLKHQLETAKNQFLEIDDYKRFNNDLKMKYLKLIDEYKKILRVASNYKKQNCKSSYGSTSTSYKDIMTLIERSNNYVPNLDKLSTSINDMRIDLKELKTFYAMSGANNNQNNTNNNVARRSLSLADELKEAEMLKW